MKLYETINAENWLKGALRDGERRRCLVGHWWDVYDPGEEALVSCRRLRAAMALIFPERCAGYSAVKSVEACFNDHPDTTVEDVIRVCKVADV